MQAGTLALQSDPDSKAIQFIVKRGGVENIWQMPLEGGEAKQITNFTSDRIFSYDWSKDSKNLAVIRGAWTADIVLLLQNRLVRIKVLR